MTAIEAPAVPATAAPAAPADARIVGYDLARCLAFFGMVVVNYRFVMGGFGGSPDWLLATMDSVTLRAAATFVMLAGVGMTLLYRARRDATRPSQWLDPIRSLALVCFTAGAWLLVDFYVAERAAERSVQFGPLAGMPGPGTVAASDDGSLTERLGAHIETIGDGSFSTFLIVGMGACSALLLVLLAFGRRMRQPRGVLVKRAVFLAAIGFAWLPLWGGDILRFYAIYLLAGVLVLTMRASWVLLAFVGVLTAAFWLQFRATAGPAFEPFESRGNLWTLERMAGQLLLDGFHPVLPWLGFLFVGILIGRLDVRTWAMKLGLLGAGLLLAFAGYAGSGPAAEWLRDDPGPKVEHHAAAGFELVIAEPAETGGEPEAATGTEIAIAVPEDFDREANAEFLAAVEELPELFGGRSSFGERSLRVERIERGGESRPAAVLTIRYGDGEAAPPDHERQLARLQAGVGRWVRAARNARLLGAEAEPSPRRGQLWPEAVGLLAIERRLLARAEDGGGEPAEVRWDTHWIDTAALANPTAGARWAELIDPFGFKSGPGYMLSATGVSMTVIALSLIVASFGLMRRVLRPFVVAGQMALTLYLGHVVVGFMIAAMIGRLSGENLTFIAFYAAVAWLAAVAFANWWRAHFKRGPVEAVMRWMTG